MQKRVLNAAVVEQFTQEMRKARKNVQYVEMCVH
jgi:hypothetical protein